MKIIAIIQARMGSQRLPGKSLARVDGRPLLQMVLERVHRCIAIDGCVVATSIDSSDDAVAHFCQTHGEPVFRGSLADVASRFREVARRESCDAFVRVNGDSPLIDPRLIDQGIGRYCACNYDLVTNVHPRTYPRGQSVEVVRTSAFERAYSLMSEPADFEHVTRVFYRRADDFRIGSFRHVCDLSGVQMSVDSADDLERVRRIAARMTRPHVEYGLDALVRLHHEDASRCLEAVR